MTEFLSNITAVVPVRSGSRRLPGKNLAPFAGKTLLEHKLYQLTEFLRPEQILVSSDSEEMLEVGAKRGAKIHQRSQNYSDDVNGEPLGKTISHIAQQVDSSVVMWAQVTSPLVTADTYLSAIRDFELKSKEGFDSLISVLKLKEYLWDKFGPLNFEPREGHVPSQQLPDLWRLTYGVIIARKEDMIRWDYYYGKNPFLFEVSKTSAVDIDDAEDLVIAQSIYDRLR